ncbi:hypothetical protein ACWCOV_25530 [Kribbella sp. NPDC002412]
MGDIDKARIQRDAQRAVAGRRTSGTAPEQAILRHLSVELYKDRRRETAKAEPSGAGKQAREQPDR